MAEKVVSVDIELAIADAQSKIEKLEKKFTLFGKSVVDSTAKADKALEVMKGTLGALGVVKLFDAATAAASRFAKAIVTDGIAAAQKQQDAVNKLNTQLQINGEYSQKTSQDLQDFASALQATTRFGDEAVIGQLAFAQAMGASAEQSKKIVTVAADMSASLGMDLNAATRNVSKTLGGFAGELGEVIPEMKKLTAEELRAGAGIELLALKFQGAAAADVKTFSGAMAQASNTFGDFTEKVGDAIIQNPIVIQTIKIFSNAMRDLQVWFITNKQKIQDFVSNGILGLVDGLAMLLDVGDGTLRFFSALGQTVMLVADMIATQFVALSAGMLSLLSDTVGKAFELVGKENPFKDLADAALQEVNDSADGIAKRVADIGDTMGEKGMLGQFADYVRGQREELAQHKNDTVAANEEIASSGAKTATELGAWEQWLSDLRKRNKQTEVANTKSALGTIATLQQSGSKELFAIGKAAAIAQATINGFEAVTKAFAIGGPLGFVLGPLVATAVAAQIAGIAAQGPGFETGGIVGGNSFTGDNVPIRVNSREAVLTLDQQTNLFNAIQGGNIGGGGVTVNIQGNLYVDSDQRVDDFVARINDRVRFANTPLFASAVV